MVFGKKGHCSGVSAYNGWLVSQVGSSFEDTTIHRIFCYTYTGRPLQPAGVMTIEISQTKTIMLIFGLLCVLCVHLGTSTARLLGTISVLNPNRITKLQLSFIGSGFEI